MKKDPLSKCKTTPSSSYFAISVKIVGSSKSACPCVRISWKRIHVHLHWIPHVARSWFLMREPGATKVIRTRACHIRPWAPGANTSNHISRDALKFNVSSWPLTHLKFWKIMIALHKSQPQILSILAVLFVSSTSRGFLWDVHIPTWTEHNHYIEMRNPIPDARMPTRISTFCVENPKLNLHSGILRGRASQIIHIFCTFLEYIDCVLLIFHACILIFMYGLTFESQNCPNVSTPYQRSCVYIRNLFCMCVTMVFDDSSIFIYIHFTWDMLVLYIHSWSHCCQTSVARRLKQNKETERTEPKPQGFFVGTKMLLDIHTASSLHGRTESRIKIIKLSRSLSTCEFPLRSALTLPWQLHHGAALLQR